MGGMRRYVAFMDNGHERFEYRYCSAHRANSKANLSDAQRSYYCRTGSWVKVVSTSLDYRDA